MNARTEIPRRVLLVEDNPGDAELVSLLLQSLPTPAGELTHVDTLKRACTVLGDLEVHAVLLDLHLPDGSGVDCVASVRSVAPQVPIVVLTGIDNDALALCCLHAGAQDYLSKNELQAEALRRAIDYAVSRVQAGTERARAQQLHSRLAAIVESSYDAIVSSTVDGIITSWNRGAERIFGYRADEALGRPVREIIRPEPDGSGPRLERRVFQARRGADAGGVEEVQRHHKDGRLLTLSVVTSVITDEAGATVGLAAILRDITEARRRDAELQRMAQLQAARERRITALSSRLRNLQEEERTRISREVHDGLGQLLTGLKMDIRWLMRKAEGGTPTPALMPKLSAADAMIDQTIQTVQRIAVELRPSALDALGLPAALRDEARRFEARTGVQTEVQVTLHDALTPAAATGMFRIFQELLTNVARHAQASRLDITLVDDEHSWIMSVRDDGVGLPTDLGAGIGSLGLLGMTERAESLGGSFRLEALPQGGVLGSASIPKVRL